MVNSRIYSNSLSPWRFCCPDVLMSLGGRDEGASCACSLQLLRDQQLDVVSMCASFSRESAEDEANFL